MSARGCYGSHRRLCATAHSLLLPGRALARPRADLSPLEDGQ